MYPCLKKSLFLPTTSEFATRKVSYAPRHSVHGLFRPFASLLHRGAFPLDSRLPPPSKQAYTTLNLEQLERLEMPNNLYNPLYAAGMTGLGSFPTDPLLSDTQTAQANGSAAQLALVSPSASPSDNSTLVASSQTASVVPAGQLLGPPFGADAPSNPQTTSPLDQTFAALMTLPSASTLFANPAGDTAAPSLVPGSGSASTNGVTGTSGSTGASAAPAAPQGSSGVAPFSNNAPTSGSTGGSLGGSSLALPSQSPSGANSADSPPINLSGPNPPPAGGQSFMWMSGPPQAPVVPNPGHRLNVEGATLSFAVGASDPAGLSLTYDAVGLPLGLSINQASGQIGGVIDSRAALPGGGIYTPTVIARNALGASASQTFTWTVTPTNLPPVLSVISDQTNAAGDTVSLQAVASDPDGNPLYFGASGLPHGVFMDTNTGLIGGTIDPALPTGSYTATVTASDLTNTTTDNFTWTVTGDAEPVVTTPGTRTNTEGDSVSFQVVATDPQGWTLSYTADGLPSGLAIDPNSGLISGVVAPGAAAAIGSGTVTVAASNDAFTTSASATFTWSVTPYVTVNPLADQANNEGDTASMTVTATAPAGTLGFTATHLPPGLGIDLVSGVISGTIAAGAAQAGKYAVQVTATAGIYSTTTALSWSIGRISTDAPTISNPGNQTSALGTSPSLALTASDSYGDVMTYAAAGLPHGLIIDSTSGHIFGFLDNDDSVQQYPNPVTVTADNGHGGTASTMFMWTVTDSALTVAGTSVAGLEGAPITNALLATVTDSAFYRSSGTYTAQINWGDSSEGSYGVVTGQKGALSVYGSHTYSRPGSYAVGLTVYDPDNTAVSTSITASVASVPLAVVAGVGAAVTELAPSDDTPRAVAFFTDANPLELASSYTALVDNGDGPPSQGAVVGSQGRFTVYANHHYQYSGYYPTTVTLTDSDGDSAQAAGSVTTGAIYAGIGASASVGLFLGSSVLPTTITFTWGDGQTSLGTVSGWPYQFSLVGTHTYATDGIYYVSVTASADDGTTWSAAATVKVVKPPINAYSAPIPTNLPSRFGSQLVATISDPNPYANGPFEAAIDWADGSVTSATVSSSGGFFRVFGSHPYTQAVVNPLAVEIFQGNELRTVLFQPPLDVLPLLAVRSSLVSMLEKNFAKWAFDGKTLTLMDVDKKLDDPTIQGQDAAALAVLKAYVMDKQGNKRDKLSANVNLFMADPKDWDSKATGLTMANIEYFKTQFVLTQPLFLTARALQTQFDIAVAKIGNTNRTLFREVPWFLPNQANPNFESVQQGNLGDCAFLAAVDARVKIFGIKFRERFKENPPAMAGDPRTFTVTFGRTDGQNKGTSVTVTEPTDAQISLYASAGQGGLWLSVIEKAYVTYLDKNKEEPWLGNRSASVYEAIGSGQAPAVPIKLLGGYNVTTYEVAHKSEAEIETLITNAAKLNYSVVAGTKPSQKVYDPATDLPSGHAYSILGINDKKELLIRNPWKGSGKYEDKFPMTLADFKQRFQQLAVEGP